MKGDGTPLGWTPKPDNEPKYSQPPHRKLTIPELMRLNEYLFQLHEETGAFECHFLQGVIRALIANPGRYRS